MSIQNIVNDITIKLGDNTELKSSIYSKINDIVQSAHLDSVSRTNESYCYAFILPRDSIIKQLFQMLDLDVETVKKAFAATWGHPSTATMYNDPYYHIFTLLMIYGIKTDDDDFGKKCLFVILMKLWNGRRKGYIRYCDPKIMMYVVMKMLTPKYLISKYSMPLTLLRDYFVPTLYAKYAPEIKRDIAKSKNLFMQSWARLNQLFVSNFTVDAETNENRAQSGLLPLYMKAKSEGLSISTSNASAMPQEDDESARQSYYQNLVAHQIEDIVSNVVHEMTAFPEVSYPDDVVKTINKETNVSMNVIRQCLKAMHDYKYSDVLRSIISYIFFKIGVTSKNDICTANFVSNVKSQIISSKNNPKIKELKALLDGLAQNVFNDALKIDIGKYSIVQRMQIRNMFLYGIIYQIVKIVCSR